MAKILVLMPTCFNPSNAHCSKGDIRRRQFINGLNKMFEYNFPTIVDFYIMDNSCDKLPDYIQDILPPYVKSYCINDNKGSRNKGVGLIYQWLAMQHIIECYDYVLHFEPRQLFINFSFFESFFSNPRNMFTINKYSKTFNTGLFSVSSSILIEYINNADCENMNKKSICIENNLYNFMADYEYAIIETMGLIWYDGINEVIF